MWSLFAASVIAASSCPEEMALVGKTCVDRWEASLVEGSPEDVHSPYEPPREKAVKAVSKPGVIPQAHMSLIAAERACDRAGKRLCTASEWVAACKGPQNTKYPYGELHVPNACIDTGRTSPLLKLYTPVDMYTAKAMNDPRLNQTPNSVGLTGEAKSCTNAYGVHDMVGNLHEWAADGAFHGGYYLDTKINGEGCDYVTTAHDSAYYDYSIGFRCCKDAVETVAVAPPPEPAQSEDLSSLSFIEWVTRAAKARFASR
jgi:formylglycine-generating enzyme required for sulfatase activity